MHARSFAYLRTLLVASLLFLPAASGVGPAASSPAPVLQSPQSFAAFSASEKASLLELMEAAQYQFTWQNRDGQWAYRAPNRAQNLSLAFSTDGLCAEKYDGEGQRLWRFGLSLSAYGEQRFPPTIARTRLHAAGERVEYRWDDSLTEWYVNIPQGVEHGLTLHRPPASGETVLAFNLRGSLKHELQAGGQSVRLLDRSGAFALLYDGLKIYDARGNELAAHMAIEGSQLTVHIDAAVGIYPLTVDPLLHTPAAIITASDAQADDGFSFSLDLDGDMLVVGASGEDTGGSAAGSAYLFRRNSDGADHWGQVKILRASDAQASDRFGASVAISGDVVVVASINEDGGTGSPISNAGAVYLYSRNQGGDDAWGQVKILRASDSQVGDRFGWSVSIDEDTLIVGASEEDGGDSDPAGNAGAAYIFERHLGGMDNWGERQILHASNFGSDDYFGYSVAVTGDTAVVGAYFEDGGPGDPTWDVGAAYVFERDQGGVDNWGELKTLRPSNGGQFDEFGTSVAAYQDYILVGSPSKDANSIVNSGSAYLYWRDQGGVNSWGQLKILMASDAQASDSFGFSVTIEGNMAVVGSYKKDGGSGNPMTDAGTVYTFRRDQGGLNHWGELQILRAPDAQSSDWFGYDVALSGETIVVGAPQEDYGAGNPRSNAGTAYAFMREEGGWVESADLAASDAQDYDQFGVSVSISDDTVVIGANGENGGSGDPLEHSGAAYVFSRNHGGEGMWGEVKILRASNADEWDYFGTCVAISEDIIVIGAPGEDDFWPASEFKDYGAAYIYYRDQGGSNNWGEVTILRASDREDFDGFGHSVGIDGDTIVVGAPWEDGGLINPAFNTGAAYVFERNLGGDDNWGELAILHPSDIPYNALFGISVAIDDSSIVLGAVNIDRAYVYYRDQGGLGNWGQVKILQASNETSYYEFFGHSVAIDGEAIVVNGNLTKWDNPSPSGAAFVFYRDHGGMDNWGEVKMLLPADTYEHFGGAVAVDGDMLAVSVGTKDNIPGGYFDVSVYIFRRNSGGADNWGVSQIIHKSPQDAFSEASVAISQDTLVIGGKYSDIYSTGRAYIFDHLKLNPIPVVTQINPETAAAGGSGFSLNITGENFLPESEIRWGSTSLGTIYNSSTSLSVNIIGSLVASEGVYAVTVTNPAPGGGSSDPAYFFVTQTGAAVSEWDSGTSTDPSGTAQATTGGSGPSTPGSLTGTADGLGTIVVALYESNPGETPSFSTTGTYMDVNISDGNTFDSLTIEYCDLGGGTQVFWWDGNDWLPISNQSYSDPCVTIIVDSTTSPSLADLTGTPFAAAYPFWYHYLPIVVMP